MRECLFCTNQADSREHLFPKWAIKDAKPKLPYRWAIGNRQAISIANPNATVKSVCEKCNHGWMSCLEDASKKIIRPVSNDVSIWLSDKDQKLIARWAIKTAIVFESATDSERKRCFPKPEREALRVDLDLPACTTVWIGRYNHLGLVALCDDFRANIKEVPHICNGCVVTFLLNHLVMQIIRFNIPSEYQDRAFAINTEPGPWNKSLIQIWPTEGTRMWPPPLSFSAKGTLPISKLVGRLKAGTRL